MARSSAKFKQLPAFEPDHEFLRAVHRAEAESQGGYLPVAQDFVPPYVNAGLIEVNHEMKDGAGGVATRLTDEGRELIGANGPEDAEAGEVDGEAPSNSPNGFAIDDDVPMPNLRRRGRRPGTQVKYPFETLAVNQSFFIPKADDKTLDEQLKGFASAISAANARYAEPTGAQETVTVPTYQLDDKGSRVKRDGHYVKTGEQTVTRDKMRRTREFAAFLASPDDKRGAGLRIFRTK